MRKLAPTALATTRLRERAPRARKTLIAILWVRNRISQHMKNLQWTERCLSSSEDSNCRVVGQEQDQPAHEESVIDTPVPQQLAAADFSACLVCNAAAGLKC